ncbi:EamA family transporter [Frigidibacter sp.]|uniref:aromatic amino acid exporter YddG n=1 Tax=Frigidibacter sp. TaxID=2586418 RepID=UPI002735C815|nr:EamA family transporter [Frigidibacter sp.]MDP3341585.1 EamA family transporter [Frigidibacter sp.]
MTRTRATAFGFIAILLWSLLALFTVGSAPVPPLLLNALTFAVGGALGLVWVARSGGFGQLRLVSWKVYAFGTAGLFGYHLLYFSALRMAPAAEAGLIAYLWPLLIVLFSGLLPGERLSGLHILGATVAFAGAALIVGGRLIDGGVTLTGAALAGYGLAFLCALTWATYSVLSRRLGEVPTASVAVFCLATAVLSAVAHVFTEATVWPQSGVGWLSVLALGLGPVGLAFYVWDMGVKKGDIQVLGTASYAAPLLSTLALVLAGQARADLRLLLAAGLVAGGAALAAWASARAKPFKSGPIRPATGGRSLP